MLNVLFLFQTIEAQYKFYVSISWNYNCHGVRECEEVIKRYNILYNNYLAQYSIGVKTRNECETARSTFVSIMNNLQSVVSSVGARIHFTTTPCSGLGNESFMFLGPNRGSSFHSPNIANEIQDWSKDYIEQLLALDTESKYSESMVLETNDHSFDEERNNLRKEFVLDTDKPFRSLNIDDNGGINSHSSDLNPYKIIPANKELVNNLLMQVDRSSAPSFIDELYVEWIKKQFEEISGCNCNIDAIIHNISRSKEEREILRNYREFQEQLLNEAIEYVNKGIAQIDNSEEKKEIDMAILAFDCYNKNNLGEFENFSKDYLLDTSYKRINVNTPNIPFSIKSLAEKIAYYNNANQETGFNAVLYYNKNINEYTIAFEGTSFDELNDIENDVQQFIGIAGSQFKAANDIANFINNNNFEEIEINFTGHSLGGALASLVGLSTGKPTYTYNALGLSDKILEEFKLLEKKQNSNFQITAYFTSIDILTMSQYSIQKISEVTIDSQNEKNNYFAESIGTKVNIGILNKIPQNPYTMTIEAHKMEPMVKYFMDKNNNTQHLWQQYVNSKNNMTMNVGNTQMQSLEQIFIRIE